MELKINIVKSFNNRYKENKYKCENLRYLKYNILAKYNLLKPNQVMQLLKIKHKLKMKFE